jgi:hypothetical protein
VAGVKRRGRSPIGKPLGNWGALKRERNKELVKLEFRGIETVELVLTYKRCGSQGQRILGS